MWVYHNPVKIEFGAGAIARLGEHIAGRRWALVTYDLPAFRDLAATIDAGPPVAIIDNIVTNPDVRDLAQSCRQYADVSAPPEVIVALGGGSIIDTAKVLAAAQGDFTRVLTSLKGGSGLATGTFTPIIAIPSTAGTGSEVTSWATVWDQQGGKKYSLAHPALYPEAAIVDPAITLGAPRGLTLATGLDALSHSLESLWNVSANPVSANFAVAAAREIMEVLPRLLDDPGNLDLRARQARDGARASLPRTALGPQVATASGLASPRLKGVGRAG